MSKKNKNRKKKVNPKRERYAKFRKEKPATMTFTTPRHYSRATEATARG